MGIPEIKGPDRNKPLCYDPERGIFITYDDIVSGKERIVHLEKLTDSQFKQLVIKRQQSGSDYVVQSMSGPPMTRDDVIEAIRHDEPFGLATVEAEASYLQDLLAQIEKAMD